jgi:integrase/recombinase XerD
MLYHAEDYFASLTGRGLTTSFVRTERAVLQVFSRYWGGRDLRSLCRQDLYDYVLFLKDEPGMRGKKRKPRTVVRYAHSVKRYLDYLARHGLLLSNPTDGFELMPADRCYERPIPSQSEMGVILDSIVTQREGAFFELIYSSGLRIAEALALELADLKLEERILLVRQGKGKKDRYVPFGFLARAHLSAYIHGDRQRQLGSLTGEARAFLFLGPHGKMTWAMASSLWAQAIAVAGLGGKGYTLHSIRHACATHLIENGASIRYVQELLGHECLSTTQRYTRPNVDWIKAVYRTYHPRENELYEELDENYTRRALALRDELVRNREVQRQKVLRYHGSASSGLLSQGE